MKTNKTKGIAPIVIILIIIGMLAVGGVAYYAGKNSTKKIEINKPNIQPIENISTTISTGLKEFRDDSVGISFKYPPNYGDITLIVTQRDTKASGPFNVLEQYKYPSDQNGYDFFNLRYFSATFSSTKDLRFGGGIECWGCEGGDYMGDVAFRYPDHSGYENFYTDSGSLGLLMKGTTKPGQCDEWRCLEEGNFFITFQVNNDYRGVSFYGKDIPENIAILKSIVIKK